TTPYKQHFVPPGAINWGDPDNNNAFYARQIVMTPNASISIPVAQMEKADQYYHQIMTRGMPLGPDGKAVTSLVAVKVAFIPKGAKNAEAARDFLKYLIQPTVLESYLENARGRWVPVMPSMVKDNAAFWRDPKDPHRPVIIHQEEDQPTMPWYMSFNPGYAEVNAAQVWGKAESNVMQGGMTPEQAVDGAFKQIQAIFAKYPVPAQ
ncbi:MAG: ABC transporter substrate-binding protein, partial [Pseudomonadota bacterium]|nr:ABC transporter substrate-binding protein [Pseudomonadota bacterium]